MSLKIQLFHIILFLHVICNAQPHKFAIGIRGEKSSYNLSLADISISSFVNQKNALELQVGYGRGFIYGEVRHLLYNKLITLHFRNDVYKYFGESIDLGYWNTNYDDKYNSESFRKGYWAGVGPVIGTAYTVNKFPINVTIDTGSSLRVLPEFSFGWAITSTIRWAFGVHKTENEE